MGAAEHEGSCPIRKGRLVHGCMYGFCIRQPALQNPVASFLSRAYSAK
ncbi:hypothetical protein AtDm6_0833 [Acetobacter tropicalis]|uniref:Uncharacterized protein n=1 Tax=Acetobacter tropicalis TaxID=104102 RepID=A0A094YUP4_9PROT|nr:hypothetical protein AtDm6_0833 [Acetobacter tropicalis]